VDEPFVGVVIPKYPEPRSVFGLNFKVIALFRGESDIPMPPFRSDPLWSGTVGNLSSTVSPIDPGGRFVGEHRDNFSSLRRRKKVRWSIDNEAFGGGARERFLAVRADRLERKAALGDVRWVKNRSPYPLLSKSYDEGVQQFVPRPFNNRRFGIIKEIVLGMERPLDIIGGNDDEFRPLFKPHRFDSRCDDRSEVGKLCGAAGQVDSSKERLLGALKGASLEIDKKSTRCVTTRSEPLQKFFDKFYNRACQSGVVSQWDIEVCCRSKNSRQRECSQRFFNPAECLIEAVEKKVSEANGEGTRGDL
jgi:hypothetical protein